MELLPHDIVEKILERLPVKSLIRFKSVSKQWKSTMESQYFQAKQLIFGVRSAVGDLDILMVSNELKTMVLPHDDGHLAASPPRTLESLSSLSSPPYHLVCQSSCDGLVCLNAYLNLSIIFNPSTLIFNPTTLVFNPTTRWHRSLPLSRLQQLILERRLKESYEHPLPKLGFGKDKINGTYKPVWLYNSSEFGLENATTCEVFDFSTNSWRYVTSSFSPYRVIASPHPLYLDGMLYWLTEGEKTKLLSLDLHTETFQVISEAPFVQGAPRDIIICNLNNCLCVSIHNRPKQDIWSFNSENKTWEQIYSLVNIYFHLSPLAILEKNKLLCYVRVCGTRLKIYDPKTKSSVSVYRDPAMSEILVCYVKSLISIL